MGAETTPAVNGHPSDHRDTAAPLRYAPRVRWIYHLMLANEPLEDPYAPSSLAAEGFVHGSYRDAVRESARLYFPPSAALVVLQIDPRALPAPVVVADTPRGPMPHIHGPIPASAVRARLSLDDLAHAPELLSDP